MKQLLFLIVILRLLVAGAVSIRDNFDASEQEARPEESDSISVSGSSLTSAQSPHTYQSLTPQATHSTKAATKDSETITLQDFLGQNENTNPESNPYSEGPTQKNDPALTEELHTYGNRAGAIINAHLDPNRDEALILDTFIRNPGTEESALLTALADDYKMTGGDLRTLAAPETIRSAHEELADVYTKIGDAMELFSESAADSESAATYNTAVFLFPDAYLGVAQTLRVYGVKFTEDEPGALFTLPF